MGGGLILIVDDERDLVDTLRYNFEQEGFETRSAHDGQTALNSAFQTPRPDVILLDLMLPDISGTEVCKTLRGDPRTKHIPVVMVTAKSDEIDRVVGFELGADDYVTKPFSVRELLLRVRALLRRTQTSEEGSKSSLQFLDLRIDLTAHRAWVADREILLTALEFKLLRCLMERQGEVQSRKELLGRVWGIQADVTTRTVDTHVKRLRHKLGPASDYIETLRGVGYRFGAEQDT